MDSVEPVFEAARIGGQIRDLDWLCRRRAVEGCEAAASGQAAVPQHQRRGTARPGARRRPTPAPAEHRGRAPIERRARDHRTRAHPRLRRRWREVLASYRAEGIRFALDDVGEGHSTLELLAASSSEFLKLGRSLTMTSTKVGSRAAMDATMAFARVSGAVVIAEGVENEFVADLMKAGGITLGQGFGLGKPTMASRSRGCRDSARRSGRAERAAPRRAVRIPSTEPGHASVTARCSGRRSHGQPARVRRSASSSRSAALASTNSASTQSIIRASSAASAARARAWSSPHRAASVPAPKLLALPLRLCASLTIAARVTGGLRRAKAVDARLPVLEEEPDQLVELVGAELTQPGHVALIEETRRRLVRACCRIS